MIPASCKRLIEVDFPIAVVSANSSREKSTPPGHPSRIHLWWARRPLAACRAVLLGLLLPDPCDADCPKDFKPKARELLAKRYGSASKSDEELCELLLKFIGEFADWNHAANATYIEIGRGLVKAAHPEETPVVVDPFAGGGSIPLEALRLGCDAFASDLNPVACFILKILLEDIPRHNNAEFKLSDNKVKEIVIHGLADALRHVGKQVGLAVEKELSQFYPQDPDGNQPVAYIWARTVRCEGIGCGALIPIFKSSWLSKGASQKAKYFRENQNGRCVAMLMVSTPKGGPIRFKIARGDGSETPKPGYVQLTPTKVAGNNANVLCPCCNIVLAGERVRAQLAEQSGGAETRFDVNGVPNGGATLLAVVTVSSNKTGRKYRLPNPRDYFAVSIACREAANCPGGTSPNEPMPRIGTLGFRVQRYGILNWGQLYSARQRLSLVRLKSIVEALQIDNRLRPFLAAALNRVAMSNMSLTRWNAHAEKMQHTFGRQALPIVWDFAELVPTAAAPGNWESGYELIADVAQLWSGTPIIGQAQQADARNSPLESCSASVWFTDPPYYDAVPYSDLSDFFFVWLKRILPKEMITLDADDPTNPLTPKIAEIVQDETKQVDGGVKDRNFFEREMARAFGEGRRVIRNDGVACVVFAHKTTEGWEALLSGMLRAGWAITASWPITTEMASRLRAKDSAALAASVHLICRPRPSDAGVGDWTEVKAAMEKRVREWLPTLVKHGVRGADAIFSCLGPALESYSRYDKVLTAADQEVPLGGDPDATEPHERGFLAYVFETLSKEALRQVLGDAETEGFEEDARMTALFLWTLQATKSNDNGSKKAEVGDDADQNSSDEGDDDQPKKAKAGFSMAFDTFIRITRPMGIHYAALEGRVIEIEKGVVRLLPVRERSEQLLGEAAKRPGMEISLEEVRQLELGLLEKRREEATLLARPKRGQKAKGVPGKPPEAAAFTVLDRLHRAMLLFSLGRSTVLRQVLETEMQQSKKFERLALALNSLYPDGSDERRMLEGVQAAMRGVK